MSTLVDAIRSNSHGDMTRLWSDSQTKLSDPIGEPCWCGCPPSTFRDILAGDGSLLDPPPQITIETWKKMIELGIVDSKDISVLYQMAKSLNSTPRWLQFDKILRLFDREAIRDFRSEDDEPLIFCMFYMSIPDTTILMSPIRYLVEECGVDVSALRGKDSSLLEDGELPDSLFEVVLGTCSRPELCRYLISKGADINYCGGHSGRGFCNLFAWRLKMVIGYIFDKHWEDDDDDEDEMITQMTSKSRRVKGPLDHERLEKCIPGLVEVYKILKEHGYNFGPDPRDKKQRTISYYITKHKLLEVDPRFGELA